MNCKYDEVVAFLGKYAEFDPKDVGADTRLKEDLGIDSLTMIMIIEDAESEFNITIDDEQMMTLRSIGDLADHFR